MRVMKLLSLAFALTALGAAPASAKDTNGVVTCKDGTTSKAGKGACSYHGGVKNAADESKAAAPSAKPLPIAAEVTCEDGTCTDGSLLIVGRKNGD